MNVSQVAGVPGLGLQVYSPMIYNQPTPGQVSEVVDTVPPGEYTGPLADRSIAGEPVAVWVGMLALLFIIGWYGRNAETLGGEIPKDIRVGFYNWLTVGIMAATFFLLGKVVFTKFPVPGVTSFFKAL